jgi:hypothetical protein
MRACGGACVYIVFETLIWSEQPSEEHAMQVCSEQQNVSKSRGKRIVTQWTQLQSIMTIIIIVVIIRIETNAL